MFAKRKGIPVERRDFSGGKGYFAAQLVRLRNSIDNESPEAFSRIFVEKALEFSGWDLLMPQTRPYRAEILVTP